MSTKDRILSRIRRATAQNPDAPPIPRDYLRTHGTRTPAETADLLAAHLTEYRARVHRTDEDGLPLLLARLLSASRTVLVPPGLPPHWLSAADATRIHDRAGSTPRDLDGVDSAVTGCALAIAETGTIVLDGGPDQGRRRITLIPDHHVCVVRVPAQVVDSVPQALERLDPARPLTWISGPSATSDIELDRVEGVHGPRTLDVVLLDTPAQ
ncbi:L-lactate dehydrogenase complex protein LldG [Streptomyces sp. 3211.6]|uniref:LutC/YkgG family protein n=1 Tax=unclassified Streptomyces TaxID=2593676 RepID=UPI000C2CCFFF|nr:MULTISPECIES: LUD domain-containing protein [unclassified Streptomyces]RKT07978.1 L-lactate dehydrogenase complex protein LldG [Streptomyces sp. 3211.6]RPF44402.1 L-lactate dehydrogenase complex protein LldG [Streptomyces sp. Ag109_G2-6]